MTPLPRLLRGVQGLQTMKHTLPLVLLCLTSPAFGQDKLWSPQWEANLQAAHAAQHPFCREVVKYSDASGPDGSAPGAAD